MPLKKISFSLLLLFSFLQSGLADTLILKDGSEIKGEIMDNQPDAIVIEYLVTPTIKDQKTVPRDSIARIVTASDDEKDFVALGSLTTPSNVLDTSFYDSLIDRKIPEFIRQYPYTSHITELREALRTFTAERIRVRQGDRRIDGVWITAAQIAADPYQLGARLKLHEIRQSALNKDSVAALKEYELLEAGYPASRVMPDAVDLALTQLELLQGQLSTAQANFDILDTNRRQVIAAAPADQAKELQDAVDHENQTASAAIETAGKDGTKFFPVFPNNKEALDQLQTVVTSEKERIGTLHSIPMRESLEATENASRLIPQGKLAEAGEQLDLASQKWPPNAEIASLRKKLDDATKAASATHTP